MYDFFCTHEFSSHFHLSNTDHYLQPRRLLWAGMRVWQWCLCPPLQDFWYVISHLLKEVGHDLLEERREPHLFGHLSGVKSKMGWVTHMVSLLAYFCPPCVLHETTERKCTLWLKRAPANATHRLSAQCVLTVRQGTRGTEALLGIRSCEPM